MTEEISKRMSIPANEMGRTDIRAYIKSRLKEESISIYQLSKCLGVSYENLKSGLRGAIPIPLDRIETILWILDGQTPKNEPIAL